MHNYFIVGYLLVLFFVKVKTQRFQRNPDVGLYATKLIQKYGYPVEEHTCETEDGYFITIQRIPNNKVPPNLRKPTPILLMHGLFGTAENFIVGGIINISLAYMLADKGYDVWVGNTRGTYWSRKHRTLDPTRDIKYWDFSWHEIGYYDLPAMIDHILETTNSSQIFYSGHSQGGTSYTVMGAARPEYNKKIKLAMLLAPGVLLKIQQNYGILAVAFFQYFFRELPRLINLHEVVPNIGVLRAVVAFICQERALLSTICNFAFFFGNGLNWEEHPKQFQMLFPVVIDTFPSSVSSRQLIHFAQIINTGVFGQYDFGEKENLKRYNSSKAPEYNFSNINSPVALYYGRTDIIVGARGVKVMAQRIPNLVTLHEVKATLFGHVDFLFSEGVKRLVYDPMMSLMEQMETKT